MENQTELIMLGTGNATVTKCYNTCFVLRTGRTVLLVDAGGGNGVLSQLEKTGIAIGDLQALFVTHAHTDHLLGAVWIVRMVIHQMRSGNEIRIFKVYGHDKVLAVLEAICRMTLPEKDRAFLGREVLLCEVKDRDVFSTGNIRFQCFDILSTKEKQYGFRAALPDGRSLVCLGDEPYNPANHAYAAGADWLLCEAFCLYKDREIFKPYEKHHSTALEAGEIAEQLQVKNLLLYHMEDRTLSTRKIEYTKEAVQNFSGAVWVPDDLERIVL